MSQDEGTPPGFSSWKDRAVALGKRLWQLPFKRVFALTAVLFFVGEFYPLSNFPMYSGVSTDADYYYLIAEDGEPVAMLTYFGIRTARAKKIFRSELKEMTDRRGVKREEGTMEERKAAGEKLLDFLVANMNPGQRQALDVKTIRLMWTVLTSENGAMGSKTVEVASRPIVPGAAEGVANE